MGISSPSNHLYAVTTDGKLWQTAYSVSIGPTSGPADPGTTKINWHPWTEIKAVGGQSPGPFISMDSACAVFKVGSLTAEHICGITQDGKLWYTNNGTKDGSWQPFKDLTPLLEGGSVHCLQVSIVPVDIWLQVCVIARTLQGEQHVFYTSPRDDGTWRQFEQVTSPQEAGFPGSFTSIACADVDEGEEETFHICGITQDGKLWHTKRTSTPSWLPFANVQVLFVNTPSAFSQVWTSKREGSLNVYAQADGSLWHAERRFDADLHVPYWQVVLDRIEEPEGQTKPLLSFSSLFSSNISIGRSGDLFCVTSEGKLWYTRPVLLGWIPFIDVTHAAGNIGTFQLIGITYFPGGKGGAGSPNCGPIWNAIGNDSAHIQILQLQLANTGNQQVATQIAGLRQDIARQRQRLQQNGCM